ncbi:MAG: peptidase [Planctomycetota bacterium]|nr:MAG: peptidase [Planctomycetota bacterium]
MMLQDPPRSPYDWQFHFLGFPVRVAWGFWVVAALLGWDWSRALNRGAAAAEIGTPGAPLLLAIWILAVFVSILVHELGHAIVMRRYGMSPRIVLYHFGGLAISDFGAWNAARRTYTGPLQQIFISAAGPGLQLLLGGAVIAGAIALNVPVELMGFVLHQGAIGSSILPYAIVDALIFPSIFWALLNLLPVLPLDGGHITENVLALFRIGNASYLAQVVSLVVAALTGLWFLRGGNMFAGLMFLMMAASNWQQMQGGFPRY